MKDFLFGIQMSICAPRICSVLKYGGGGINICVLMIYCALNNNTFKLFLRVHIEFKVVIRLTISFASL